MQRNLVRIIIPAYNRKQLLKRALVSCDSQTFMNFSITVVDDGSAEEINEFELPFLEYKKIPRSGLPGVVRNYGIKTTSDDLLAFLDSDDEWFPDKLAKQIAIFKNDPEIGLVCSNAIIKKESCVSTNNYLKPGQGRAGNVLIDLIQDNFIITSSVMIKRNILEEAGIFPEDPRLRGLEDYDLWLRIAAISKIYYTEEPFVIYWDYSNSLSGSQSLIEYWEGQLLVMDNLSKFLIDKGMMSWLTRFAINRKRAFLHRQLARILVGKRDLIGFLLSGIQSIFSYINLEIR